MATEMILQKLNNEFLEKLDNFLDQFLVLSKDSKDLIKTTVDAGIFKSGSIIVEQGKKNKYMYVIIRGVVRGYCISGTNEITLTLWMENHTFGDVYTYVTQNPALMSYESLEDLLVLRFNIEKFRELVGNNLELCNLGRLIVERFIIKTEYYKNIFRNSSAAEKFEFFKKNMPGLIYRVKSKYIASYLDITPETLSRLKRTEIDKQKYKVYMENQLS